MPRTAPPHSVTAAKRSLPMSSYFWAVTEGGVYEVCWDSQSPRYDECNLWITDDRSLSLGEDEVIGWSYDEQTARSAFVAHQAEYV